MVPGMAQGVRQTEPSPLDILNSRTLCDGAVSLVIFVGYSGIMQTHDTDTHIALSSGEHLTPVPSCPHSCFLELPNVRREGTAGDRSSKDVQFSAVWSLQNRHWGLLSTLNLDTVLKLWGSLKSPLSKQYRLGAMFQEGRRGMRWLPSESRLRHWVSPLSV